VGGASSSWDANGRGWQHSHIQAVAALRSWLALPSAEILLFGQPHVCKAFLGHAIETNNVHDDNQRKQKVACHSIPCTKTLTGDAGKTVVVPTMDCLFRRAAELARTDVVV